MDAAAAAQKPVKINRWLPYWAVFQADIRQTLGSWVYRVWVVMSILAAAGYLLYKFGAFHLAGLQQSDAVFISDLLHWTVLGSVTLIIVLTAGCISSERGTMADSVLSRGISRYQYFLGKWHARLVAILGSFFVMAALWLIASFFLLHQELKFTGALVALVTVAGLLMVVITLGVTVSAISHSTVLSIALLWIFLYGASYLMSLMPERLVMIERVFKPNVLLGNYDLSAMGKLLLASLIVSVVSAGVGMVYFSRCDV